MNGNQPRGSRPWRAARLTAISLVAIAATGPACLSRPLEVIEPRRTSTVGERLTQSGVDKIDLLLAIDNSRSMADKQKILNLAVPDLVNRLVNPLCINPDTKAPITTGQPTSPNAACPAGAVREFQPVLDIHIGVVDSSLGGHGSDACPDLGSANDCAGTTNTSQNDYGHLVTRVDPCQADQVPTYQSLGFLAWDGDGKHDAPPGETAPAKLKTTMTDLVSGVGQIGCGFESQNEGWYRFLVDPNPYKSITVTGGKAVMAGTDTVLLKQRGDFLRPSSLLAIIVLTDENDCSVREGGQYYVATQLGVATGGYHLPPARSECATNPNDPCCKSCGQPAGSCAPDPNCSKALDALTDSANLRCFDNKRRFGIDFLYPWQRYVNALSQPSIDPQSPDLSVPAGGPGQPNPVFSDLQKNPKDTNIRSPDLVFMAGIVGVPWQDIARLDKTTKLPNLLTGADANGDAVGGFQSAAELRKNGTWDVILGDPDAYKLPTDPHMHEQIGPRNAGDKNPITGDAIAPPGPVNADAINGHEYTISLGDDLQYACIFELPKGSERDCSKGQLDCDCSDAANDKPLCVPNPADGNKPTLQTRAKGYPGIRHLQILKGLSDQGIVASVCPKQVLDDTAADFGYRPAVGAIIDRLKIKLAGQCLSRTLTPDPSGHVSCLIIEAKKAGGACTCDGSTGRSPVAAEHQQAVTAAEVDPLYTSQHWDCFCEINQASDCPADNPKCPAGNQLTACQNDESAAPVVNNQAVNGWCYIDDTTAPAVGNPTLVETCPATEKRIVRFVGAGKGAPGATLFITCSGE